MTPVSRSAARAHEHALARCGNERVRSLQEHDARIAVDRSPQGCQAMRFDPVAVLADQPGELAGVRREHARRGPVGRLELEERVRVHHGGQLELADEPPHERSFFLTTTETRADRQRRGALRELVDSVERPLDGLEQPPLHDGQRLLVGCDRDVPGVGAKGSVRGQADGAGHAGRAAHDQH